MAFLDLENDALYGFKLLSWQIHDKAYTNVIQPYNGKAKKSTTVTKQQ
jgi:hypothetical protein